MEPTPADVKAAAAYAEAFDYFMNSSGSDDVSSAYLAGILAERERAAGEADDMDSVYPSNIAAAIRK